MSFVMVGGPINDDGTPRVDRDQLKVSGPREWHGTIGLGGGGGGEGDEPAWLKMATFCNGNAASALTIETN